MDEQQWMKHEDHFDEHISWPATKEEILAACNGLDVDEEVLQELKENLPDGETKYSKQELYELMVG